MTEATEELDYTEQVEQPGTEEQHETEAVPEAETAEQQLEPEPAAVSEKVTGKLSLYQEVSHRLLAYQEDLCEVEEQLAELKEEQSRLRKRRDSVISSINGRLSDLRDIENGCYQRTLFTDSDGEQKHKRELPPDPGLTTPIGNLGLTEKEVSLLNEAEICTIAELEERMRLDSWWHKKVKGFGPTKVDKLTDALCEWRMRNPVPTEDDLDHEEEEELETEAESGTDEAEPLDAFDQEEDDDPDEAGETADLPDDDNPDSAVKAKLIAPKKRKGRHAGERSEEAEPANA